MPTHAHALRAGSWLLALALFAMGAGPADGQTTQPATQETPTEGMLEAELEGGERVPCPLEHTAVKSRISGYLAHVEVRQVFQNPFDEKIEAVYTFPLPQNAAVHEMVMRVGEREIHGEIHKRERARYIYEQAKDEGKRTALLEQERPNIFTQSVANIGPGKEIVIVTRYVQPLRYDAGTYRYHFPMVVGPRFIPGQAKGEQKSGTGWAPDTDLVPDASKITPPVLEPGMRTGHDISLEVELDAGVPVEGLHCRSHDVVKERRGEGKYRIRLEDKKAIPNKDFMLEYEVAGDRPRSALLTHRSQAGGYFMLMLQPPLEAVTEQYRPKEMFFVLDCSGSMRGEPMAKSKQAMVSCIRGLGQKDTFQIIRFSSDASRFSNEPVPSTRANKQKALEYVNGLAGSGGTQMIEGVKTALGGQRDDERQRVVFFFTDGYIGNEKQILAAVKERLDGARIFSFGIGSSVNRQLIEGMAKTGKGKSHIVRQDEDPSDVIRGLYSRLAKPFLADLSLSVDGVKIREVVPEPLPDLLQAQPLIAFGRYEGSGEATVTLEGELRGEAYEETFEAAFPEWEEEHASLPATWARQRIRQMTFEQLGKNKNLREPITELALDYGLMSEYTSFVAVDEKMPSDAGSTQPRTVAVPVPMPEGVSYEGVFGPPGENPGRLLKELERDEAKADGLSIWGRRYQAKSGARGAGQRQAKPQNSRQKVKVITEVGAQSAANSGGGGLFAAQPSPAEQLPGLPEKPMRALHEADNELFDAFQAAWRDPEGDARANDVLEHLLDGPPPARTIASVALVERMAQEGVALSAENREAVAEMREAEEPAARSAALQILLLTAEQPSADLLEAAAEDPAARTRRLVVRAYLTEGKPASREPLQTLLTDEDPRVRALAIKAAAEHPGEYVAALAGTLTEAPPKKFAAAALEAARALAGLAPEDKQAAQGLLAALERPYPAQPRAKIRIAALKGLEGYRGPDGEDPFRELAREGEDDRVRALACERALVYPEAVAEIRERVLEDDALRGKPELVASAFQSARRVEGGEELSAKAEKLLRSGDYADRRYGVARVALLETMLDRPTPERLAYAQSLLRTDRSWKVRRAVLARLAEHGGKVFRGAGEQAIRDPHPVIKRLGVAFLAIRSSQKLGEKERMKLAAQPSLATCEGIFEAAELDPAIAMADSGEIWTKLEGDGAAEE